MADAGRCAPSGFFLTARCGPLYEDHRHPRGDSQRRRPMPIATPRRPPRTLPVHSNGGLGAKRANSRGHGGPELYESAALLSFLLAD
jgi:hypothetical protein